MDASCGEQQRVAIARALANDPSVVRIDVPEPARVPEATIIGTLTLSNAIFGFFILALSGVIVFSVLIALLAGQTRPTGVMKAVGGTRTQVAGVYLLEAGLLGVGGVAVALPMAGRSAELRHSELRGAPLDLRPRLRRRRRCPDCRRGHPRLARDACARA